MICCETFLGIVETISIYIGLWCPDLQPSPNTPEDLPCAFTATTASLVGALVMISQSVQQREN